MAFLAIPELNKLRLVPAALSLTSLTAGLISLISGQNLAHSIRSLQARDAHAFVSAPFLHHPRRCIDLSQFYNLQNELLRQSQIMFLYIGVNLTETCFDRGPVLILVGIPPLLPLPFHEKS